MTEINISQEQVNLVQFCGELSSRFLINLFMNEIQIYSFTLHGMRNENQPAVSDIEIHIVFNGKLYIYKQAIFKNGNYLYDTEIVIIAPSKMPPSLVGSNGQMLRTATDNRRKFPVNIMLEDEAIKLAKELTEWLFEVIGKTE